MEVPASLLDADTASHNHATLRLGIEPFARDFVRSEVWRGNVPLVVNQVRFAHGDESSSYHRSPCAPRENDHRTKLLGRVLHSDISVLRVVPLDVVSAGRELYNNARGLHRRNTRLTDFRDGNKLKESILWRVLRGEGANLLQVDL